MSLARTLFSAVFLLLLYPTFQSREPVSQLVKAKIEKLTSLVYLKPPESKPVLEPVGRFQKNATDLLDKLKILIAVESRKLRR